MSRREEKGFPCGSLVKNLLANMRERRIDPRVGKISWKRKWQPTPVILEKFWRKPWTEEPGALQSIFQMLKYSGGQSDENPELTFWV